MNILLINEVNNAKANIVNLSLNLYKLIEIYLSMQRATVHCAETIV